MGSVSEFLTNLLNANTDSMSVWQIFLTLLLAYAGGVLSSLTPCIYPMIPITVGVVGGMSPHADAQHRARPGWREVFLRCISYIAGMTSVYSFLGVTAGLTGKIFGSFTNSWGWYFSLGVIMTLAALWMLEVIQFDPMAWWHRRSRAHHARQAQTKSQEMTYLGAFGVGVTSGFIASPCTTPVLTSILAYIAKTQSIGIGLLLMTAFSLGLSTLLLLIGLFTGGLQILPRSGKWMNTVKWVSGLILLAFADYLLFQAGTRAGVMR